MHPPIRLAGLLPLCLAGFAVHAAQDEGMVTLPSAHDVRTTVDRAPARRRLSASAG